MSDYYCGCCQQSFVSNLRLLLHECKPHYAAKIDIDLDKARELAYSKKYPEILELSMWDRWFLKSCGIGV